MLIHIYRTYLTALAKVIIETKSCTEWFLLGAALGLSYETLESIRQTQKDASMCKVTMLNKWLCGMDDVSKEGGPS